jgi:hypothetical protein
MDNPFYSPTLGMIQARRLAQKICDERIFLDPFSIRSWYLVPKKEQLFLVSAETFGQSPDDRLCRRRDSVVFDLTQVGNVNSCPVGNLGL